MFNAWLNKLWDQIKNVFIALEFGFMSLNSPRKLGLVLIIAENSLNKSSKEISENSGSRLFYILVLFSFSVNFFVKYIADGDLKNDQFTSTATLIVFAILLTVWSYIQKLVFYLFSKLRTAQPARFGKEIRLSSKNRFHIINAVSNYSCMAAITFASVFLIVFGVIQYFVEDPQYSDGLDAPGLLLAIIGMFAYPICFHSIFTINKSYKTFTGLKFPFGLWTSIPLILLGFIYTTFCVIIGYTIILEVDKLLQYLKIA